tara:strand:+ start:81 stop:410 length:330 start_codon:yes stop_codon:yes gene_type:complete
MKNIYKFIFVIIFSLNFLNGCQSLKDGLEGNKKSKNAEEFLIDKKNALTIPPDFSKLPTPEAEKKAEINESDFEIENILQVNSENQTYEGNSNSNNSLEESILEKIKQD